MKRIISCLFYALANVGCAMEHSRILTVEIDHSHARYRMVLRVSESTLEYDSSSIQVPSPGLAPQGVRAFVREAGGRDLSCQTPANGYSSFEMSSGDPFVRSSFKKIPPTNMITSDWFLLEDLLRGLDQCCGVGREHWARLMIRFTVRVRGKRDENVAGETSWLHLKLENGRLAFAGPNQK